MAAWGAGKGRKIMADKEKDRIQALVRRAQIRKEAEDRKVRRLRDLERLATEIGEKRNG